MVTSKEKKLTDSIQPGEGAVIIIEDVFQYVYQLCPIKDEDAIINYLSTVANEILGREPAHADDLNRMLTALGLNADDACYVDLDVHSILNSYIYNFLGTVDYDNLHEFYVFIAWTNYRTLHIRRHKQGTFSS